MNHIITFCLHFSDGSALNHYHHNTNYTRGSTDAIATVEDSDFDDFSDSGGGSNEDKDAIPPAPLSYKHSPASISSHHQRNNNHNNVTHMKSSSYSQYHQNHVTNVIVETPPPTFNSSSDYNSETGAGSGASTTSSSSGFNSGEGGGVTSEHKISQSSCSSSDTSAIALASTLQAATEPTSLGQTGQTENEIEEICYQATTTTFSKVHTVPQFDDDDLSESPPPPPSQPPPLNDDFDVSEVRRSSSGYAPSPSIGQCRALYDYYANMYDELTIHVGDIINIHDKQGDGWWLGELRGTVGIFPATYVEEMDSNA